MKWAVQPHTDEPSCRLWNCNILDAANGAKPALLPRSVQCCVTSPPYWALRDYGVAGQLGSEKTVAEYVANMVRVFDIVKDVLRDDGTLWLNLGDTYVKKQLMGIPWRVAFALQDAGWLLRSEIIWHKRNPMPEACKDRPTRAHEQVFLFTKRPRYFFDPLAISEPAVCAGQVRIQGQAAGWQANASGRPPSGNQKPGSVVKIGDSRNARTVWTLSSQPCKGSHFAPMPKGLAERCIKAGTPEAGACSTCGAPIARTVDRKRVPTRPGMDTKTEGQTAEAVGNRDPLRHVTTTSTTGWQATCKCEAQSSPCVVFDPFNGAGTTGLVARQLGRSYVGVELNPAYCDLTVARLFPPKAA